MQLDPVAEEAPQKPVDREAADPDSSVHRLREVQASDGPPSSLADQEEGGGLERFVRFLQHQKRNKKNKEGKSLRSHMLRSYEKQIFMEEASETIGMRLNKAS